MHQTRLQQISFTGNTSQAAQWQLLCSLEMVNYDLMPMQLFPGKESTQAANFRQIP